jgi:hypothetical protein
MHVLVLREAFGVLGLVLELGVQLRARKIGRTKRTIYN